MLDILQQMGQALVEQLAWWKVLVALGGSIVITGVAFGILIWAEQRQTKP